MAQIQAVIADLGEVRRQLAEALETIERAGHSFASAGAQTDRPQLPAALDACAGTAESLVLAIQQIDRAREQLWLSLGTTMPGLVGPRPVTAAAPSAHEVPEHVRRNATRLPARRSDDGSYALGKSLQATHGIAT